MNIGRTTEGAPADENAAGADAAAGLSSYGDSGVTAGAAASYYQPEPSSYSANTGNTVIEKVIRS